MLFNLATALLLPATLAAPTDVIPPYLTVQDMEFGSIAPVPSSLTNYLGLVPGHTVRFQLGALPTSAGGTAILAVSTGPAPVPLPIGEGFIQIDPVGLQILGTAPLDAFATATFDSTLPAGLPVGAPLATQALTIGPALEIHTSNRLEHEVTDLAVEELDFFFKSAHPNAGTVSSLVIDNPLDWQQFWAEHQSPSVVPPPVDFTRKVAIVSFGGHFITFGYAVQIDALVPLAGGGLEVQQSVITPGFGCGTLPSESDPGVIVTVDRVAGVAPNVTVSQTVPGTPCP